MSLLIGIDIGGTFTDFVCFDRSSNDIKAWKNLSTPENPFDGVLTGLKEIPNLGDVDKARLGTTIATNAILQRKGAGTAYITTKGFKDIPFIQRGNRKAHYDVTWIKSKPLVKRQNCFEIEERINSKGEILKSVDEKEVKALAKLIKEIGSIEAVAINFLFSYINPDHELKVKSLLKKELEDIYISTSFEVLPKWKEYERASTTIADAYLKPIVGKSFASINEEFKEIGLNDKVVVMQSNGGENSFQGAMARPVQMTVSGPTGGVVATRELSKLINSPNLVSLDMGGTSTDCAAVINFQERFTTNFEIEWGVPIQVPMIDVRTIGAGGGSIAWIDKGGLLQVGPQSAGANPGPACYGKGGNLPTVTDANMVLGRLDVDDFLGGSMKVDRELAKKAIEPIAKEIGKDLLETADAIIQIANNNMVDTLRTVLLEKGHDPRDFSLVAFGGAGPLHVNELIELEGIPTGIVPLHPGQFSALGFTMTDARVDRERTVQQSSANFNIENSNHLMSELEKLAIEEMLNHNKSQSYHVKRVLDLRYLGQNYELQLDYNEDNVSRNSLTNLWNEFHKQHQERFNFSIPGETIELVNISISVISEGEKPKLPNLQKASSGPLKKKERQIWISGSFESAPVFDRHDLLSGHSISGPAVVRENASTTILLAGYNLLVDDIGNLLIRKKES